MTTPKTANRRRGDRRALLGGPFGIGPILWAIVMGLLIVDHEQAVAQEPPTEEAPAPDVDDAETPSTLRDTDRQANLDSFDQVWETIRDQHWEPEYLEQIGWEAAREELRPRVEAATSMSEVRSILGDLLKRLDQSHFGIVPQDAYNDLEGDQGGSGQGQSGLSLTTIDDRILITKVAPESPADRAGLKPGLEILAVDDQEIGDRMQRIREALDEQDQLRYLEARQTRAVLGRIRGDVGQERTLTVTEGPDAEPTQVSLTLDEPQGKPARFANLPTFYVESETQLLTPEQTDGRPVAYFRLNAFFDPASVMSTFREAIAANDEAVGLIIDLRGNPGGIGFMAVGMGGYLIDEANLRLGIMQMRTSEFRFALNPQPRRFNGPVAVLVDGSSMSTSEILSGGLQDIGRARIFGTPTPGACLPSQFLKLPNGDRFQVAMANYVSADGEELEGQGVQPDEVVVPTQAALLDGRDPALEAALQWIADQQESTDVEPTDPS